MRTAVTDPAPSEPAPPVATHAGDAGMSRERLLMTAAKVARTEIMPGMARILSGVGDDCAGV